MPTANKLGKQVAPSVTRAIKALGNVENEPRATPPEPCRRPTRFLPAYPTSDTVADLALERMMGTPFPAEVPSDSEEEDEYVASEEILFHIDIPTALPLPADVGSAPVARAVAAESPASPPSSKAAIVTQLPSDDFPHPVTRNMPAAACCCIAARCCTLS